MAAVLTDLRELDDRQHKWFEFTWEADYSEDWRAALEAIKARIPWEWREFDQDTKRWTVRVEAGSVLATIFPNFRGALAALRSQRRLF
jgi:hypothetical protein